MAIAAGAIRALSLSDTEDEDETLDDTCLGRLLRCPCRGCCTACNVDRRNL